VPHQEHLGAWCYSLIAPTLELPNGVPDDSGKFGNRHGANPQRATAIEPWQVLHRNLPSGHPSRKIEINRIRFQET
jgi:hypothetical protein